MSRSHDSSTEHAAAQRLLPWLLTGTLDDADLALVERHLRSCAACRQELAWERRLRAACRDGPECVPALDPDAALARLAPRLTPRQGPQPGRLQALRRWLHAQAANDGRWWRPLAAAQFAVIAALTVLLLSPPASDRTAYRTLGAGAPVQGDLVVSFRPDTPERELRRILQASGTRVLDGPTAAGAYVLAASGGSPARALARLRAEPAVTLAQPLVTEGRP